MRIEPVTPTGSLTLSRGSGLTVSFSGTTNITSLSSSAAKNASWDGTYINVPPLSRWGFTSYVIFSSGQTWAVGDAIAIAMTVGTGGNTTEHRLVTMYNAGVISIAPAGSGTSVFTAGTDGLVQPKFSAALSADKTVFSINIKLWRID